jgi:hypothetical protein
MVKASCQEVPSPDPAASISTYQTPIDPFPPFPVPVGLESSPQAWTISKDEKRTANRKNLT